MYKGPLKVLKIDTETQNFPIVCAVFDSVIDQLVTWLFSSQLLIKQVSVSYSPLPLSLSLLSLICFLSFSICISIFNCIIPACGCMQFTEIGCKWQQFNLSSSTNF